MDSELTSKLLPNYRSYLVRLWRSDNAGQPVCRASLEAPGSQAQIHFDNLADLCSYLTTQMGMNSGKERES